MHDCEIGPREEALHGIQGPPGDRQGLHGEVGTLNRIGQGDNLQERPSGRQIPAVRPPSDGGGGIRRPLRIETVRLLGHTACATREAP